MQKARKPDAFEKIAGAIRRDYITSPWAEQIPMNAWLSIECHIAQALRRYHARVRRMVQRKQAPSLWTQSDRDAYELALSSILGDLDKLKRGAR